MKLIRVRGNCNDEKTCPTLYRTDHHTAVVQGWTVVSPRTSSGISPASDETAVEVPTELVAEALAANGASGLIRPTERGTVVILGPAVTDPEALEQLALPAEESAIEVPIHLLSEVFAHVE